MAMLLVRSWGVVLAACALLGCLSANSGQVSDVTAAADGDATPDPADDADTSEGPPELACECEDGEVYRGGPCVPTLALGCGPGCDDDGACEDGLTCARCAASSSCGTRDCLDACAVPYAPHAPVLEPLRITPAWLEPGGGRVVIAGTAFFIGALGHSARLGEAPLPFGGGFTGECELTVEVPADTESGVHPIWVSQYSGGDPWVLAGLLHVGEAAPACAQPGFPCGSAGHCCATAEVPMACAEGRCQRVGGGP